MHPRGRLRSLALVLRQTVGACLEDKIDRLGAALAFYTTVAVAPLLMMAVAFGGLIFRHDEVRRRVLGEVETLAGRQAGQVLQAVQLPPGGHSGQVFAWVGAAVFAAGGLGVFFYLQDALNTLWRVPRRTGEPWRTVLKRRVFSFGAVVATGFIMLVSLFVSAILTWIGDHAARLAEAPPFLWEGANFVLTLVVVATLFAVIFKLLPDVPVRWNDVWTGSILTALLFVAGKTMLGVYLAHTRITSAYGSSGSLIALLLWCYYTGQILFFGAEFTRMHAAEHDRQN